MKLEYLLTLTKEGITIYSGCFGTFCANLSYNKTLMSGFLSAIATMPESLGHDDNLKSIEMGYTKLLFSHTHPSEHIICAGIIKDSIHEPDTTIVANELFKLIGDYIETRFPNKEWGMISNNEYKELEETMVHKIIEPTLEVFTDNDVCNHNECPFDHNPGSKLELEYSGKPFSEITKAKYVEYKERTPLYYRILAPIVVPIMRFRDRRLYKKKLKFANTKQ